jgi:hypothetical protein
MAYTARLAITGNHQIYLPVEIQKILEGSEKISPRRRLYDTGGRIQILGG